MVDRLWKSNERFCAKLLGGKRIPVNSTDGVKCDVSTPVFSVECKETKALPKFFTDAVQQAKDNCEAGKTPLLVIHIKGQNHDRDLVVWSMKEFLNWHGGE